MTGKLAPLSRSGILAATLLTCCGFAPVAAAGSGVCKVPEEGSDQAPILSPPLGKVVIGKGRLQFYSAPNVDCKMDGVFVIPKDSLVAYAETPDGWTSVMYAKSDVLGWVRSSRLKTTGTMGPSQ